MHAYLITGGDEKQQIQRVDKLISKLANAEKRIVEITPEKDKKTISIDEIRKLKKTLSVKIGEKARIFILIPQAHLLNQPAQNSFLKLLEEPPERVLFILCAPNRELLLPTIVSRCANINLVKSNDGTNNFVEFNGNADVLDFFSGNKKLTTDASEAVKFCENAERFYFGQHTPKSQATLKNIFSYKKYFYGNGISPKIVLENIFLLY